MKTIKLFSIALILIWSTPAFAQTDASKGLRQHLIPPKHVLRAQDALQLSNAQKKQLKAAIKKAQHESIDLQFDLESASEKMMNIVKAPKVDLAKAESQAKKVMALESKLKLVQLKLSIQTKNLLTPVQQKKVIEFMKKRRKKREAKRRERENRD